MNESRMLIIGAYGQLGKALQAKYPKAVAVDRDSFDMTDWDMVDTYDWSKIDVILNAAAYTNVDAAETPEGREAAWKINAQAVGYLARVATAHDITLVHISSEYVFDGIKTPHTEDEPFSPLGVYAQTKAAGDIAVSIAPKHYILRTSWVIGDGKNFVRSILGLGPKQVSPNVVADQFGRLTFTTELVRAIDHLLAKQPLYGTYNISNDGDIASWADVARQIYEYAGFTKQGLKVGDTTAEEYFAGKISSPRPTQSALDMSKIKATGFEPRDWRDDLRDYIQAELAKPKE
jgi:dTDP-4-dehydrorhamnose 3,5-epimerase/reductase